MLLLWLYLSAYVLLMGAELNAELEREIAGHAGPSSKSKAGEQPPARQT